MLNDNINEYGSMYDISQVTIGDLIRRHSETMRSINEMSNIKHQVYDLVNIKDAIDRISKLLGYYDVKDVVNRAPIYTTHDINPHAINNQYSSQRVAPSDNKLLEIDKFGNIWINGNVENNPTKIGNEIIKLASNYKDNLPIADFAQYFKPESVAKAKTGHAAVDPTRVAILNRYRVDDFDDLPF